MDSPCHGHVLLVGDGDFSFTVSLLTKGTLEATQVTTSNLASLQSIQQHKLAMNNMGTLMQMGVQVLLEVDAREVHTHPVISQRCYQRIIFNFPLADRHNIRKNRALLADFFSSCAPILAANGQIMVTLCRGQGGTPADQPMRSWHDSWQVLAMATNAGFILREVLNFDGSQFQEYHSVGFRFQDKSFNTVGALTHVFEKAEVAAGDPVSAECRGTVKMDGCSFSCSSYVADKMNRNLLQETDNPICVLNERLTSAFHKHTGAAVLPGAGGCVLPGHRSRSFLPESSCDVDNSKDIINSPGTCKNYSADDDDSVSGNEDLCQSAKERKNQANRNMKSSKNSSLVHGCSQSPDVIVATHPEVISSTLQEDGDKYLSKVIPDHPESVFILVKDTCTTRQVSKKSSCEMVDDCAGSIATFNSTAAGFIQCHQNTEREGSTNLCVSVLSERHKETEGEHFQTDSKGIHDAVNIHSGNTYVETDVKQTPTIDSPYRIFHCRTSLLENLGEVCDYLHSSSVQIEGNSVLLNNISFKSGLSYCAGTASSQVSFCTDRCTDAFDSTVLPTAGLSEVKSPCTSCVLSGQCFLPGPITNDTLSVRHELMFVQLVNKAAGSNSSPTLPVSTYFDTDNIKHIGSVDDSSTQANDISQHLLSCLHSTDCFSNFSFQLEEANYFKDLIQIETFSRVDCIQLLFLNSRPPLKYTHSEHGSQNLKRFAGVLLNVERDSQIMAVLLIQLDKLVGHICNITDPRIIWSSSPRFTSQFDKATFPNTFKPFSLYPMSFVHDVSFWIPNAEEFSFDEAEMYNIVRCVAGDLVCLVKLIDQYFDLSTGQQSRCYRLYFQSHDLAFPYVASWKLQSVIRIDMVRKLGVILRKRPYTLPRAEHEPVSFKRESGVLATRP